MSIMENVAGENQIGEENSTSPGQHEAGHLGGVE